MEKDTELNLEGLIESLRQLAKEITELEQTLETMVISEGRQAGQCK